MHSSIHPLWYKNVSSEQVHSAGVIGGSTPIVVVIVHHCTELMLLIVGSAQSFDYLATSMTRRINWGLFTFGPFKVSMFP